MDGIKECSLEEFMEFKSTFNGILLKKLSDRIAATADDQAKITIILRSLRFERYRACISEWMLEALQWLAEIFGRENRVCSETMKTLHCSIAVDCTLRFLEIGTVNHLYIKAVEDIWKGMVTKMKMENNPLLSEELEILKPHMEISVSNSR
ncbi:hypothetical protein A2U01_0037425, partial [Trifolium medium]|nr:hypothetical protein [Trifolium medium]